MVFGRGDNVYLEYLRKISSADQVRLPILSICMYIRPTILVITTDYEPASYCSGNRDGVLHGILGRWCPSMASDT
jgi:hypothetical protein